MVMYLNWYFFDQIIIELIVVIKSQYIGSKSISIYITYSEEII